MKDDELMVWKSCQRRRDDEAAFVVGSSSSANLDKKAAGRLVLVSHCVASVAGGDATSATNKRSLDLG